MAHVTTSPHHNTKNQSFLLVPFHLSHSKTNASTNKSKDSRAKNPKTQMRKNVDVLSFSTRLSDLLAAFKTYRLQLAVIAE